VGSRNQCLLGGHLSHRRRGAAPPEPALRGGAGRPGSFLILWYLFWKTDARYQPGKLVGTFILVYGVARFAVEFVRQPDEGLENLSWGLSMGQTLSVPMILGGIFLIATAKGRRERVEPIAGHEASLRARHPSEGWGLRTEGGLCPFDLRCQLSLA
jgi:hypothetical protein